MNAEDAIELLLKMTASQRSPANLERAASICQELGYLALAVAQAGAYIAHSCSLGDYLHIYREDRARLLQRHSPHSPDDYEWTVYTTWEMSLKKLTPTTTMFLRICSFMHHGGISRAIFENAAVANIPGKSFDDGNRFLSNFKTETGEWSRLAFVDHTKDLLAYSLINLDTETDVYSIHPLVHAWSRDRASPVERDEARVCALQILALAVGTWQLETSEVLALWRSLLPHVDVCRTADVEPDVASQVHHVYTATGRWNVAEELLKLALDARRALMGNEHLDTVWVMAQLVYTYNEQGRLKEAEELGLQVLQVRRRVLGEEHPATLSSMTNLAHSYWRQERWEEARGAAVASVGGGAEGFRRGTPTHTCGHGQLGGYTPRAKSIEGGGGAVFASDGGEAEGSRRRTPRHTYEHGSLGDLILAARATGGSQGAGRASPGETEQNTR